MSQPVVLVTGAGSGLGAAVCRALSATGRHVVLSGRREGALRDVAASITESTVIPCDVRDEAQVSRLIEETILAKGRLDVLVNNAGVFRPASLEETSIEDWDDVIATNLRSTFLLCKAAWPHLKETRGQIVNVSSVSGTRGFANGSAYCASKFGMNGLSAVLALEGKPHGIRVSTLCPAQVATPIWERLTDAEVLARMMTPEQIADIVQHMVDLPRNMEVEPIVVVNASNPFAPPIA